MKQQEQNRRGKCMDSILDPAKTSRKTKIEDCLQTRMISCPTALLLPEFNLFRARRKQTQTTTCPQKLFVYTALSGTFKRVQRCIHTWPITVHEHHSRLHPPHTAPTACAFAARRFHAFTTGNPSLGTKLLGFSIGRGLGALKGLTRTLICRAVRQRGRLIG